MNNLILVFKQAHIDKIGPIVIAQSKNVEIQLKIAIQTDPTTSKLDLEKLPNELAANYQVKSTMIQTSNDAMNNLHEFLLTDTELPTDIFVDSDFEWAESILGPYNWIGHDIMKIKNASVEIV
ncbi:hypothetical protein PAF15_04445 [Weissella koreensis]|uniref:Uncharacterized protein n=1 Tax=Weissella koreensis TaxID=165096 RepID=A0A7H1MM84_9LACO|nr:hypothetical protein [Weissella koreensis]AEJ23746.1 hypothetical protein WKK_04365 [Weissella koreensis KACC 15510]AVH75365.1 hypothetical protein C4597_04795 [Weissella koreensis]EJF34869.1 hypothetical protein JC2156_11810 [Weissella koreensis KCTC 3621]MCZ9311216.1 hypothetical protein [Weissella koreensis]QGN20591.1 hypothetical protein GKC51_04780 [Weissella koreensis]